MNAPTAIPRPRRIFARSERDMPKGAVFLGPTSKWWPKQHNPSSTPAYARETYRQSLAVPCKWLSRIEIRNELRGKDIASACPPEQESFVDVLIDIANSDETA
ncbi:hypothetical protein [Pacificibacter marinus]|uniref:hypothetical protein n=1 Tax=Pacificibacter marinus TaxID=658057 RepID=UPI001C07ABE1|nr:hypothetical protein [Pacificibacter marinus]MBU2867840.1 hypothetical protein [Pacificibacter marinus]